MAGDPTTYEHTYTSNGNAFVIMSINCRADVQGAGLPRKLIQAARAVAKELGVNHLLGSFRPTDYGKYKLNHGNPGFEAYCKLQTAEGLPFDAWLRNLTRNGMIPIKTDEMAMQVTVGMDELHDIMQLHKPYAWRQVTPGVLECGEVGSWYLDFSDKSATYRESNVWGELPIHTAS